MEPRNPYSLTAWLILTTKLTLWAVWCLVLGSIGLLLCATVVLLPLGLAVLSLAAMPLTRILMKRNAQIVDWEARWLTVDKEYRGGDVPWEI